MMIIQRLCGTFLVLAVVLVGCSGGSGPTSPVLPGAPQANNGSPSNSGQNTSPAVTPQSPNEPAPQAGHYLWAYTQVFIDPATRQYEIIPQRDTTTHLNILLYLEQSPCKTCFKITKIVSSGSGTLLIDIQITHPFPNANLTGFDVRGIAMFQGSHVFTASGLNTPDRAVGDGEMVNADGYTTLYNSTTEGSGPSGMQGYIKGKFASAQKPDAKLNGYKRHIYDDPNNTRNAFYAGKSVTVTYEIDMPDGPFIFGYAVDANWAPPTVKPVTDPMTQFPPEANCLEPWKIEATPVPIGQGLTDKGGDSLLDIYVYDRQGYDTHKDPVIECPELFDGTVTSTIKEEGIGYARYEVTVSNTKLAAVGSYECLVSVEANENDPVSQPWLDLTAYQIQLLEVVAYVNQPPVAKAKADPNPQAVHLPVHFTDDGSTDPNPGGGITNYEWDWNNDGTYEDTGNDVQHTWDVDGTFPVQFRVTAKCGLTDTLDQPLEIVVSPKQPPEAHAKFSPKPQTVCETVNFEDDGSFDLDGGLLTDYEWDWNNDGTFDEHGKTASHVWTVPGIYPVQFRVTDDEGTTDTLDQPLQVVIQNALPTASAVASTYKTGKDVLITFDASSSVDNDCQGHDIIKYEWDWTNDGTYDATGVTSSHSYSAVGIYYVQLRVTDDEGGTDTLDTPLHIEITDNPPPIAFADFDPKPQEVCKPVSFYNDGSYDPGGGLIVKYEWDWENDGTYDETGSNVQHTWNTIGVFDVQFRVTNNKGETDTLDEPLHVTIQNVLPTAAAVANKYAANAGEKIWFDASASIDNDCGQKDIVKWEWDWENDGVYDSTGIYLSHTFASDGLYHVQLRVTDDEGGTDTLDTPMEIFIGKFPPKAYAKFTPNPQTICLPVHFQDDGSYDPDGGLITLYEWDWNNDGVYEEQGADLYHTWNTPGTYTVRFRVTDDELAKTELTPPLQVSVLNALPTASGTASQYKAHTGVTINFDGSASKDNDCGDLSITKWEWDWNNDGTYDDTGVQQSHSYGTKGDYQVVLRVTDDESATATYKLPLISITDEYYPPVAIAAADPNPQDVCLDVHFHDNGSYDPDGGNPEIVKYEWDLNNDGVYEEQGADVWHSFDSPDVYTVQFRVTDDDGAMDTLDVPLSVQIKNVLPVPVVNVNTYVGYVNAPVYFNGERSYDGDCIGQSITNWQWDWNNDSFYEATGHHASHSWSSTGTYQVQFGATDNEGWTKKLDTPVAISIRNGWARTWGQHYEPGADDYGYAVAADTFGNVYVAGAFQNTVDFNAYLDAEENHTSNGSYDCFLSKLNSNGDFAWARTWGGATGDDMARGVATDSSGNVYVTGLFRGEVDFDPGAGLDIHTSTGTYGYSDIFVSKFDPAGGFVWAKTWGGESSDEAYGVAADTFGNVFVTGDFYGWYDQVDFDPGPGEDFHNSNGYDDVFLSKFTSAGAFQWARTWGGNYDDYGYGVAADASGNAYVTGYFYGTDVDFDPGTGEDFHSSNSYNYDVFVSKFTSSGSFTWARTWGGSSDYDYGYGRSVAVGSSGDVWVTGDFYGEVDFDPGPGTDVHNADYCDAFLSKFNSSGDYQWADTWGGSDYDYGYGVSVDSFGNPFVAGRWDSEDSGYSDAALRKYDPTGQMQWDHSWPAYECYGISVNSQGHSYVTGYYGYYGYNLDFDPGPGVDNHKPDQSGYDVFLSKFPPDGNW